MALVTSQDVLRWSENVIVEASCKGIDDRYQLREIAREREPRAAPFAGFVITVHVTFIISRPPTNSEMS